MKALSPPRLRHNVAALMSVQALGYLIPMITLPYVTRVLGATGWGSVAWTQVVIGYFILLTNCQLLLYLYERHSSIYTRYIFL